ncbi:MAG: N-acetylglucosamine-6-phosphate deacetylase [Firmicutes bacterium]|mgnify:CR=1 FL=1|nr:N-acetylglucosamine-6-phosphate deacetylase [Bacillota bacterium]
MDGPSVLFIRNGTIVTPRVVRPDGAVLIADGRIAWVGPAEQAPELSLAAQQIDAEGGYIAPGFVDIHLHGGGGADFMDATPEAVRTIARCHASGGTTAFVGSTVTTSWKRMMAVVDVAEEMTGQDTGGAELVGFHIEGPFLAPDQIGAHDPELRRDPQDVPYEELLERGSGVKRITVAPELPGALELIQAAARRGWHIAMGHSNAVGDTVLKAMGAGCRHVTHLFSCTSVLLNIRGKKSLGINEYALIYDDLTAELIADGHHLTGELAALVIRRKGVTGCCLVTDGMRAVGMPPGIYNLGDLTVLVEEGVAKLPDRSKFAGSVATMAQLVRQVVNHGGLGICEAITVASLMPATLIGIDHRKGSLDVGKDGDIVVLSSDLQVRYTIAKGRMVYSASSS